jgi:diaminopimelate decarboxylase
VHCTPFIPASKVDPQLTAVVHAGADLFLRQCYCPEKFQHRVQLLNRSFQSVSGVTSGSSVDVSIPLPSANADDDSRPLVPSASIAGPLCFSGDVIAGSISIPVPMAGDYVIALDAGANSISLFSRHCSRASPAVYAYVTRSMADGSSEVAAACVRPAESTTDIFKFWGAMNI